MTILLRKNIVNYVVKVLTEFSLTFGADKLRSVSSNLKKFMVSVEKMNGIDAAENEKVYIIMVI
jgi:hypothetical protein